jgi:D-serine deaminase-like pyridoxal phosphate-dependent protein
MMSNAQSMHSQLPDLLLNPAELKTLLTPALACYPEIVDLNIKTILGLLNGDARRWQPHVKTSKMQRVMRQMCARGVVQFKCATTLELLHACRAGAKEVLMAYPSTVNRARRICEIASEFQKVRICATVENAGQVAMWKGSRIGLFIDINPGMNRTGIDQEAIDEIVGVASAIHDAELEFAGLHYYDGHHRQSDLEMRRTSAYAGYDKLMIVIEALERVAMPVPILITSGTPALPCSLTFPRFQGAEFLHRVSPGTIVFNDATSLAQLPAEWDFRIAAVVVASVVSHPSPGMITCDAGHKAVSSDAGFPNCVVLGHPELEPQIPSEEHLPIRVPEGASTPKIGEILYLVPKHVCTTVHNFDSALLVRGGKVAEVAPVEARGRELFLTANPDAYYASSRNAHE